MKEILIERHKLLQKAKNNPKLQQAIIALCKKDIMYFFDNFLWTDKNKNLFTGDEPSVIPFIPFEFQKEFILETRNSIENGTRKPQERDDFTNVFVEKSRQMGISWVAMAIFVYGWIFHDHKYLVISQKEEDVDKLGDMKSLFEKIRFMIENIPTRMLPKDFDRKRGSENNKYKSVSTPHGTWSITGESANPNAGRWGTYNAIFLDEMAFMQNATSINTACASATPCRIFNSTPNGQGNEFYRMREMTQDRVVQWIFQKKQIKGLRYHRTDHPKYDEARYKWKIQGMTPEKIAQELEIDYNTAIVWRVYPEFPKVATSIDYDIEKPIYISIDNSHGWQDPNAIIISQLIDNNINIIDSIEISATPEDCARFLTCNPTTQLTANQEKFLERYKRYNWRKAVFIADPYDTKSAMWNSTILDDYKKLWINLMLPSERRKVEQIMKTRTNMYRIQYNDNCLDFASAIMNAKYPERKETSNSTKEQLLPVHNRTSHYRTSLEYLITYILENPIYEKPKPKWLTDQPAYKLRSYR